jgi:formate/nitrite transporter
MALVAPVDLPDTAAESGATKARQSPGRIVVASFLAGAFIAFGGLLAVVASAGLPEGGATVLATGATFTVGLMLVVIAGADLATGNMATVAAAAFQRRVSWGGFAANLGLVLVGNLLGALFVAYFLADQTGVVTAELPLDRLDTIAAQKAQTETDWQIFLRAVGCNWLVCLAVWMALAAKDVGGKILAIFFPILAFVAMGFDHVVANMFFLPAAIFAGTAADVTWGQALENWLFAGLGNLVGGAVFVAGAYWYVYGSHDEPGQEPHPAAQDGRPGRVHFDDLSLHSAERR